MVFILPSTPKCIPAPLAMGWGEEWDSPCGSLEPRLERKSLGARLPLWQWAFIGRKGSPCDSGHLLKERAAPVTVGTRKIGSPCDSRH